tara:strand:+ start:449 stop:742 length:294 start_codon:yes stop_codon:yes gene_type:complete
LKIGATKLGHPVKGLDANFSLCFLISKVARLELGPDDGLPTADLRLNAAALIVAGRLLLSHSTMGSYVCNMAVTNAQVVGGARAQDRVLGWWDRDFD